MANHLHWYKNGTIGAADGEEIDITQPIDLGAVNTFARISTGQERINSYYPIIGFPLYLRTETGYEIAEGTLKCGYYDEGTQKMYIGAIGNTWIPALFKSKEDFRSYITRPNFTISYITNSTALTINQSNKITSVNSMLFICVLAPSTDRIGSSNPLDLINFSFTETAVTA